MPFGIASKAIKGALSCSLLQKTNVVMANHRMLVIHFKGVQHTNLQAKAIIYLHLLM